MSLAAPGPRQAALRRYSSDGASITSNERLVVMLYERLCNDIVEAAAAMRDGRPGDAHRPLINAQEIVEALDTALDLDRWPEGIALRALYDYVGGELVQANLTKDPSRLDTCLGHVEPLRDAWREAWAATAGSVA